MGGWEKQASVYVKVVPVLDKLTANTGEDTYHGQELITNILSYAFQDKEGIKT